MKENSVFLPVMIVIFLAVLMAYIVSSYAKKSNNLSAQISAEQLASFTNENLEYVGQSDNKEENFISPVEFHKRQAPSYGYDNMEQAIKSLNIGNITYATPEDLYAVGATDWSLTNTVAANLKYPQVIEVVFNNKNVLEGFFSRKDVTELLTHHLIVSDLVMREDSDLISLVNSNAVKNVLKDEELLSKIFNSALVQQILASKSANYFLKHRAQSKNLIENNKALAPLTDNENLKNILLNNPKTKSFARLVFAKPEQNQAKQNKTK